MNPPCVFLCTEKKDCFAYQNGYEDVTTSELKILLELGRETIHSLEAELETRQVLVKLEESTAVAECTEKLRKSIENLKILGRLDKKATKLVTTAASILRSRPTNREGKLYQTFLRDIYRQCGREQVVLCAAGLGKQRVVCLNTQDRTRLVHYVKTNTAALTSPVLNALVDNCQIPNTNELFMADKKRPIAEVIGDDQPKEHNSRRSCREDERTSVPSLTMDMRGNRSPPREQEATGMTGSGPPPSESEDALIEAPTHLTEAHQHADVPSSERRIEYRYSEAPVALIPDLGETLTPAMQTSIQWKWERELGGSTTDCLNILSPKNRDQDISITILVGFEAGTQLVRQFQLLPR